jgi:hypothetical protein
MKLSDNPTIIGIVGVLFVEDAVAMTSTFITFGAVLAALLMIRLRRKDNSLFVLGVLGLRLRGGAPPAGCARRASPPRPWCICR